jgi:hypothetical protein
MVYSSDKTLKIKANNQQNITLQGGTNEKIIYKKKNGLSRLDAFAMSHFSHDFIKTVRYGM